VQQHAQNAQHATDREGSSKQQQQAYKPLQLDVCPRGMAQQRTAAGAFPDSSKPAKKVVKQQHQQQFKYKTRSRLAQSTCSSGTCEDLDCIRRVLFSSSSTRTSSTSHSSSRSSHYTPIDSPSLSPEQQEAAILERRFTAGGYNHEITQSLTTSQVILMVQHSHNQHAKLSAINELTARMASKDPYISNAAKFDLAFGNPAACKELIRTWKGEFKKGLQEIPGIRVAAEYAIKAALG
jgi:hypothetical protein